MQASMLHWSISEIQLPLQYNWKISRGSSDFKVNFIVEAEKNGIKGLGETAPNIRYQETPEKIREELKGVQENLLSFNSELNGFEEFLDSFSLSSSLRFGIESAFVHLVCKEKGIPVNEFFGLPKPDMIATARSLPIMPARELKNFWELHRLSRFRILKVKVDRETAIETLSAIRSFTSQPLIVDANESWREVPELEKLFSKISGLPIIAFEQPLPDFCVEEYKYLKEICPFPLFADESVTRNPDFNLIEQQFHGINVKMMKAGGYINAIHQLQEAKKRGMRTMLGCMVETSIGISSAMQISGLADISDLDGFMILKEEPFNLVQEKNGFLFF